MYLSRIRLNPLANTQELASILCNSYREHQVLWQLFGDDPDASRDFLFRQVIEQGKLKYYVLSERIPVDKRGIWLIDSPKLYEPKLSEGQQLFFTLRVNPVVTVTNTNGKKQRHDVVMHEKKRIGFDTLPASERLSLQGLITTSCTQWLASRAEANGFMVDLGRLRVEAYQQHTNRSKKHSKPVRYSTVDFEGVLTVSDEQKFTKMLFSGIGKSKAFGCGLMLIRRL